MGLLGQTAPIVFFLLLHQMVAAEAARIMPPLHPEVVRVAVVETTPTLGHPVRPIRVMVAETERPIPIRPVHLVVAAAEQVPLVLTAVLAVVEAEAMASHLLLLALQ
jgi:hypothetical protein